MQIGNFIRTANGYEGMIETATLDLRISLVPADPNDAEKAPDWRIHRGSDAEGPEIGAGWNETGERAGDYAPKIFLTGAYIAASGGFASIAVAIAMSVWRAREMKNAETYGSARWATEREVRTAGLLGGDGVVLGKLGRDYLRGESVWRGTADRRLLRPVPASNAPPRDRGHRMRKVSE